MSYHRQSPPSAGSEHIVGKLHGALAVFRKERDDLYRSKELAQERLRLIVEERQAMEKTVNAMQVKLNDLNSKIQGNGESKNIATLQTEVERLDQEAKFQHAELVGKRQKYGEYKAKLYSESKKRLAVLATARESERKGRESRQSRMAESEKARTGSTVLPQSSPSNLTQLVDHDFLLHKLPRLISENTKSLQDHALHVRDHAIILARRKQALEGFVASFNATEGVAVAY